SCIGRPDVLQDRRLVVRAELLDRRKLPSAALFDCGCGIRCALEDYCLRRSSATGEIEGVS
ncbi:MAG: hypothetical protein M3N39_01285, partial [Pseudomonadota bacterium]|nr:hypothetical protein [Pseudomonadota bacterium]